MAANAKPVFRKQVQCLVTYVRNAHLPHQGFFHDQLYCTSCTIFVNVTRVDLKHRRVQSLTGVIAMQCITEKK